MYVYVHGHDVCVRLREHDVCVRLRESCSFCAPVAEHLIQGSVGGEAVFEVGIAQLGHMRGIVVRLDRKYRLSMRIGANAHAHTLGK
jgi:hypothetical protein